MGWNYRVLRRTGKLGSQEWETFAVHEVYYDKDGRPHSCTEDPVAPGGDTLEEARESHAMQAQAFDRPVLEYGAFAQKEEESDA